ncbi:intein C-terminal splicing region/intein N-terminal splicing region/RHS repeat-associated core domain-containing protein [Streptomyces sp. MnatMP-M17]|nr:intein C-terminal splicing region/intein N-terminal splicing region/RHS repeat-associated core domain-containing protein [Streptomyces sp. MnatMP-M17]
MNHLGSSARRHHGRRTWGRRMAAVLAFALIPGLLTPVAFASAPDPLGKPELEAPRPAKVSAFTAKANKQAAAQMKKAAEADRAARRRAKTDQSRKVTWPAGGKATLALPAAAAEPVGAAPGSLPVTLTPPAGTKKSKSGTKAAEAVTVEVLDQTAALRLGVKGVVLTVTGPSGGGGAELGIDYSAFASAYGGDWAGRLQVLQLADCALDDPSKAACRKRTTLDFANDRSEERLRTELTFAADAAKAKAAPASGQTMVLALAAGTKSGAGDYNATPLAASSTWEAGGSSGTFTWSYPLRTPPAAAGPAPDLSISYDSGAVDGRTASSNNQGTAIGEGFDITSSYIERKYGSCDDDGQADKSDLCWKYDNASLVLNGRATELVKDDTTGTWRLKNDDASTVTHSTGAENGDDNGEYWTLITGDGTKYVFGLNKLDGAAASDRTQSVWTVPVFGDDAGEPGYADGTSFSGRDKNQAWRWNLDYVEDLHDNAMSYWYEAETNNYDKLGDDNTGTGYIRGGYLKEIRYGQRADALFSVTPKASNKVVFSYAERCLASGSGCDSLTEDTRDNWPDVPFDAVCKDGDKCTGIVGPSFFTRKRMTGITTYMWDAAAATPDYTPVDVWALKQQYLDPGDTGDSSDQSLWLDEIRHTGKRGADLSLDPVTFLHEFRPNRVDGATDDILSLEKPRLKAITSEAGAQTIVTYADADCVAGQTMPKVDENNRSCYPVYWSPNGGEVPQLDWFQKYPVTTVSTTDPQGGSEAVVHTYQYTGGGAWHYNDDPLTKEKERTWSIWRGFGKVTHLTGNPGRTQSKTVTVYLRGMDGDRLLGTDGKTPDPDGRRRVKVTGVKAAEITDSDQYAGFTRESVTYNGTQEVGGQINDPWSKRTATQHKSYADTEAYYVRTDATHARTNITSSGIARDRVRTTGTTFDDYGMPVTIEDKGDDAVVGDETCTRTWYARNDDLGINNLTARTRTVARTCATAEVALDLPADSTKPGDVVSDTATAYDSTTWSAAQKPTKGDVQWTGRAKSYGTDDQPAWQQTATFTYDTLGRALTVKDANNTLTATTGYTPVAAGPLTKTTLTNAKNHVTTTVVDPATGAPITVTDPNGKMTDSEYDSLGRLTKVWLPNKPKFLGNTPNYVYGYSLTASALSWVSTSVIKGNNSGYNTTYEIYDSLLRPRQVQSPSPAGGRLIAQTLYDDRGLGVSSQGDIWDETAAPSGEMVEVDAGQAPVQTDTTYDGAGRATRAVTKHYNVPRWTIDSTYTGDTVTTTAPDDGQATAAVTNALGQTTQQRQYGGPLATGTDYTTTDFTYTPGGQQKTVTGPDKSVWTYEYDLFGRQTASTDPDSGRSTTTYNELDQVVTTTDSRSKSLISEYDVLGRQTGLWDGTKSDATKLAAWTFDSLAKGQGDTAVRYENGVGTSSSKAYTTRVTKYDPMYQVQDSELTLPANDTLVTAGVPQTLKFSTVHHLDGTVSQYSSPAVGGLPSEVVGYTYNATGQQLTATGSTGYLLGAAYSPQGDLNQLTLGTDRATSAKKAYLNYQYEPGTRRLIRSYATDDVHGYMPQELKFTQDEAGNVRSIFDATTQGGTTKADYQCFDYDGYRRLTEAWTPKTADCADSGRTTANIDGAAPYWTTYKYNEAGQRKTETKHTATGDSDTNYTYGTPAPRNQPHPLTGTTGARAASYAYDETGNTISRPGVQAQQTLIWNTEGKLVSTTEPAVGSKSATGTSYLYDAAGELLVRRNTTADGDTVLYLGDTEVRLTTKGTAKTLSGTRYYTAAGQTIAVRTAKAGVTGSKLTFLAGDHHGTSSLALEAGTYAITKRYTTPFGAPRGTAPTTWPDDKAFLGKPADTTTGLTHIGAREYDPAIGQFASVDPILTLDQHQSFNGYSYANQHPATSSDPTGLSDPGGTQCGYESACAVGPKHNEPLPIHNESTQGGTAAPRSNPQGSWEIEGSNNKDYDGDGYVLAYPGVKIDAKWKPQVREAFIAEFYRQMEENCGPYGLSCEADALGEGDESVRYDIQITAFYACGATNCPGRDKLWGLAWAEGMQGSNLFAGPPGGNVRGITGKPQKKGGGGCTQCFLAGTDVLMADGTTEDIEDVKIGEEVQATDPETGESAPRKVTRLIVTEDDKQFNTLSIATDNGVEQLTATFEHPFWSPSEKSWLGAAELKPGMTLLTDDGTTVIVTANRAFIKHARTYNLTVDDLHTYYVLAGETPVLVHNSNCDVAGRRLWQLTKEGSTKLLQGGPFKTTFYKSSSDGTWWTPDVKGHGGSAFKVYRETSKGLEWISDADKYGDYMPDKWKGDTGKFIPNSNLRGVKR